MGKIEPIFTTEYKDRLFKVVGGSWIELEDGSRVNLDPTMVVDVGYSDSREKK